MKRIIALVFFLLTSICLADGGNPQLIKASPPVTYINGFVGMPESNGTTNGFLSAADWTRFNLVASGTFPSTLTIPNLILSTATPNTVAAFDGGNSLISVPAGTNGQFLSQVGGVPTWATVPSAGISALTGDVTATGPGSAAATVHSAGLGTGTFAAGVLTTPGGSSSWIQQGSGTALSKVLSDFNADQGTMYVGQKFATGPVQLMFTDKNDYFGSYSFATPYTGGALNTGGNLTYLYNPAIIDSTNQLHYGYFSEQTSVFDLNRFIMDLEAGTFTMGASTGANLLWSGIGNIGTLAGQSPTNGYLKGKLISGSTTLFNSGTNIQAFNLFGNDTHTQVIAGGGPGSQLLGFATDFHPGGGNNSAAGFFMADSSLTYSNFIFDAAANTFTQSVFYFPNGDVDFAFNAGVSGTFFAGATTLNGNLLPGTDNTYDIGKITAPVKRFANEYLGGRIVAGNTANSVFNLSELFTGESAFSTASGGFVGLGATPDFGNFQFLRLVDTTATGGNAVAEFYQLLGGTAGYDLFYSPQNANVGFISSLKFGGDGRFYMNLASNSDLWWTFQGGGDLGNEAMTHSPGHVFATTEVLTAVGGGGSGSAFIANDGVRGKVGISNGTNIYGWTNDSAAQFLLYNNFGATYNVIAAFDQTRVDLNNIDFFPAGTNSYLGIPSNPWTRLYTQQGLYLKTGANSRLERHSLSGGTIVVANTSVTANTDIICGNIGASGTVGALSVAPNAGVGYTITSNSGTDNSLVACELLEEF